MALRAVDWTKCGCSRCSDVRAEASPSLLHQVVVDVHAVQHQVVAAEQGEAAAFEQGAGQFAGFDEDPVQAAAPCMRFDGAIKMRAHVQAFGFRRDVQHVEMTVGLQVGEPEERTVFYFCIGSAVVGILGMTFTNFTPWNTVRWQDAAWVIPIGILASLGQWCMTRAYSKGATLVVASMQYFGIIFAVIFSLVLLGDHIAPMGWAGIGIIITSGILATVLRARALPDTPAEEH